MILIKKKLKGYEYLRNNQKTFFPKAYSSLDDEIAVVLGVYLSRELHEDVVFKSFPEMEPSLNFWINYINGDVGTACRKHGNPDDYIVGNIYTEDTKNVGLNEEKVYADNEDGKSLLSFSYGIESLLTYCILSELNIQFKPVNFIWECPDSHAYIQLLKGALNLRGILPVETLYYNNNFMAEFFKDDFLISETHSIPITLPQFIMRLISTNTSNVIVGNEKSCDASAIYRGRIYYYTYDQSSPKLREMDDFFQKTYGTSVFSILYPISKTSALKILYNRYDKNVIKRVHISCHNTAYGIQNCGFCEKCGRVYAIMKSLGLDTKDMFNMDPFNHLEAFPDLKSIIENKVQPFNFYLPGHDPPLEISKDDGLIEYYRLREVDFALAKCVELGIRSRVTDIFKEKMYPYIEGKIGAMEKVYTTVDSNYFKTIPNDIRDDVISIFTNHLDEK